MSHKTDQNNSSFIFGLVLGAIIGAVVAILIYKNNKNEVLAKIKNKFQGVFDKIIPQKPSSKPSRKRKLLAKKPDAQITKKAVDLPPELLKTITPKPSSPPSKPRTFKRK